MPEMPRPSAHILLPALAMVVLGWAAPALAQGSASSFNPAAAASDTRNSSSINPAARASDTRSPTSINPAAAASDPQRFGVVSPGTPALVTPRPGVSRLAPPPERQKRHARRTRGHKKSAIAAHRRAKPARQASAAPGEARAQRKTDGAASRIMGSVCRGC
jgi:hypothetical protein